MRMRRATELMCGMTIPELAESATKAFRHAGGEIVELAEMAWEIEADGWIGLVGWAANFRDQNVDSSASVADLTAIAYRTWNLSNNVTEFPDYPELDLDDRIRWEAIVRHLFGILESSSSEVGNLGEREAFWAVWAQEQLAKRSV